jgi:uncharacterized protein
VENKEEHKRAGIVFENLVASNLLKYCHYHEDCFGFNMSLQFYRDKEKRKVDFIVSKDGKPEFAVECKTGDKNISPHLKYLSARKVVPKYFQVHLGENDYIWEDIQEMPFEKFCLEVLRV